MNPLFRTLGSVAALATCAWGIYVRPRRQPRLVVDGAEGLGSEEAASLQERGTELIRAGHLQEAVTLVLQLLQAFPANPNFLQRAATLQTDLGHFKEAAELWERFLQVAPDPAEACPGLWEAYRKLGQPKAAVAASERIVALAPGAFEPLFCLGQALEADGQYRKARQAYEQVLATRPRNQDARIGVARMDYFNGSPLSALIKVERVLAESPDNTDALLIQGLTLQRLGRLTKAREVLERGQRLAPGYGDFPLALAGIAEREHDPQEAVAWLDRYLALHPDDAQALARRARNERRRR